MAPLDQLIGESDIGRPVAAITSRRRTFGARLFRFSASLAALLSFPLLLFGVIRTREFREIDYDEGINLIKSHMINHGHRMYHEIWADQPPFFPHLLAGVTAYFPGSLLATRCLVLSLTALLVWAFFELITRQRGLYPAIIGVIILASTNQILRVGGAVMIGIPCAAFGILALLAANLAFTRESRTMAYVAGAFSMLSVATKFYGAVFGLPILVLLFQYRRTLSKEYLVWLCLGAGTALVYVLLLAPGIFTGSQFEVVQGHIGARAFRKMPRGWSRIRQLIWPDLALLPFAFAGVIYAWVKRDKRALQPISLLAGALLFLYFHRPVWAHHYPLVGIPLAWLSALGVTWIYEILVELYRRTRSKPRRAGAALVGAALAAWFGLSVYRDISSGRDRVNSIGYRILPEVVALIKENLQNGGQLYTDRPIYTFLANADYVVPHAVVTAKRLRTGLLKQDDLVRTIHQSQPKLILLARFPKFGNRARREFEAKYDRIYEIYPKIPTVLLRRKP